MNTKIKEDTLEACLLSGADICITDICITESLGDFTYSEEFIMYNLQTNVNFRDGLKRCITDSYDKYLNYMKSR